MNRECLTKAAVLAEKGAFLFVTTASFDGYPHVTPAARLQLSPDEARVAVDSWFCPGTLENLKGNEKVDLVVWDVNLDEGYQLLGKCQGGEDLALLNGYDASLPAKAGLPRVERRIQIQVEKALPFQRGSHTVQEEC